MVFEFSVLVYVHVPDIHIRHVMHAREMFKSFVGHKNAIFGRKDFWLNRLKMICKGYLILP